MLRVFKSKCYIDPLGDTMLQYMQRIQRRRSEEQGASAVEYGLLVAAIAALIVLIVFALGGIVKEVFTDTCTTIKASAQSVDADC